MLLIFPFHFIFIHSSSNNIPFQICRFDTQINSEKINESKNFSSQMELIFKIMQISTVAGVKCQMINTKEGETKKRINLFRRIKLC